MLAVALGPFWLTVAGSSAAAQSARIEGFKAFAIEATGGVAGSAIGFGAVVLATQECESDFDLVSCISGPATAALALSTVGAAAGTILVGQANRTEPSLTGAIVGALVGAVAAVGADHLIREELDFNVRRGGTMAIVTVTQGLVTAATSRVFLALRKPR
ncbi:MAG: hypothetical protein ACRENU_17110 [Gemmatimonadaceae bacterium]